MYCTYYAFNNSAINDNMQILHISHDIIQYKLHLEYHVEHSVVVRFGLLWPKCVLQKKKLS